MFSGFTPVFLATISSICARSASLIAVLAITTSAWLSTIVTIEFSKPYALNNVSAEFSFSEISVNVNMDATASAFASSLNPS